MWTECSLDVPSITAGRRQGGCTAVQDEKWRTASVPQMFEARAPALQAVGGLAVRSIACTLRHVQRGQHLLQQSQARMLHSKRSQTLILVHQCSGQVCIGKQVFSKIQYSSAHGRQTSGLHLQPKT